MLPPNIKMFIVPILLAAALTCASCTSTPTTPATPDLSSPAAAYRAYLLAIQANNLPAATAASATRDANETDFANALNSLFINSRRLYTLATAKFSAADLQTAAGLIRPADSDAALTLALARIDHAMAIITNDTATLTFYVDPANKNDGPDAPVFKITDDPVPLRNVGGIWKVDLAALAPENKPDQLLAPGTLGSQARSGAKLAAELCAELESGAITTFAQFKKSAEEKIAARQQEILAGH